LRRRDFLHGCSGSLLYAMHPLALRALAPPPLAAPPPRRGFLVAVPASASDAVRSAARVLTESVPSHPLLSVMAEGSIPSLVDTQTLLKSGTDLAYNHLVLVGSSTDPLITAVWQREALLDRDGIYIFGFGRLRGDIGYIESDRNPFLHAEAIARAPYETEVITLTGTTDAGIALAVRSFVRHSLVNGVIANPGWTRTETTLLNRDPLPEKWTLPALAPDRIGDFVRIAYTQASEDEYRGVLEDTGTEPSEIWRVKYFRPGAWDGVGSVSAFDNYAAGLHRRAYGNTLWLARFKDATEAAQTTPKIAAAAHLQKADGGWTGMQPAYANGTYPGERKSAGPLTLWQRDQWVAMSTFDMPPLKSLA
jgi:hypothetical protein